MADQQCVSNGNGHNDDRDVQRNTNLRNFVTQEYQSQRLNDPGGGDGISDDRATQFLQRALSESQRMTDETSRSERSQRQLYAELGKERFEQWTKEHLEETVQEAARKKDEEAVSGER